MTKHIKKQLNQINLFFTFDRAVSGLVTLELINDFTLESTKITLPEATVTNERYTLYIIENTVIQGLIDGLYTYNVEDNLGQLEVGSMKIEGEDFGQNTDLIEAVEDGDDFIVVED